MQPSEIKVKLLFYEKYYVSHIAQTALFLGILTLFYVLYLFIYDRSFVFCTNFQSQRKNNNANNVYVRKRNHDRKSYEKHSILYQSVLSHHKL